MSFSAIVVLVQDVVKCYFLCPITYLITGGHRARNEPAILPERYDDQTQKNGKINPLSSQ